MGQAMELTPNEHLKATYIEIVVEMRKNNRTDLKEILAISTSYWSQGKG